MALITSWERTGMERIVMTIINQRFETVPANVPARLDRLSVASLDDLAEALLDIETTADLDKWLTHHVA